MDYAFADAEIKLKPAYQALALLSGNSERFIKKDAESLYHICKDYATLYEQKHFTNEGIILHPHA